MCPLSDQRAGGGGGFHYQWSKIIIIVLFIQLFMYEALGLCNEGDGGHLIDSAEWITNKNGNYITFDP